MAEPQRPRMLHVVALCENIFTNNEIDADLKPLAEQLDTQLWGLLPGFHLAGFGAALLAAIVVGLTGWVGSWLIGSRGFERMGKTQK